MNNTKKIAVAFVATMLLLNLNVFANPKRVSMIQKITVVCPCDMDFLKESFGETEESGTINVPWMKEGFVNNGSFFLSSDLVEPNTDFEICSTNYLFLKRTAALKIPSFAKCHFDGTKDAMYYTGSWTVTFDPYTFEITNVEVKDEFDDAKAWFEKKMGAKFASKFILMNGNLLPLDDK